MNALTKTWSVVLLIISSSLVWAQAPVISSVDKYVNSSGARVTISGNNFGTNAAILIVYFGSVKATINSVSNTIIEATVPAGTTFDDITVTNSSTGLTAFSNNQSLLSFGGQHPFNSSDLQSQLDLDATSGLYDLCLCDLDGDGKNDVASVNTSNSPFSIFKNNSTVGNFSFTKVTINVSAISLQVKCGDLNGDGKKDLVISEGGSGNRVFVIKNNSTSGSFSFAAPQALTLTGKRPKQIEIKDLDKDGKPELIITDQGTNSDIIVFPNTSTTAAISFGTMNVITITGGQSTDGLAVEDINGDNLLDIVTCQSLGNYNPSDPKPNVFILENKSTPGNINLSSQTAITIPSSGLVNLRVGDLDGDSKPDLAVTRLLDSDIAVLLNQSNNGTIQFSSATSISTEARPWGIDFSDMDGDGKNDIVVASITTKTLTLLDNGSTLGALSFQKSVINTTYINRHLRMGDMDGDSKPDIAFTSIDDTNNGIAASKISIIRNKACMTPQITPSGPLTICNTNTDFKLISSESAGATFQWKKDGIAISGTATSLAVAAEGSGIYTITAISEGGTCVKESNQVKVDVVNTAAIPVPAFTPNPLNPVCIGSTLTLTANSAGASDYQWTGPASFTASGATINRSSFKTQFAGRYNVDVIVGTGTSACVAQQGSIMVESVTMPEFKASFSGSDVICSGDTKVVSVSPVTSGFTYQWLEKTKGPITGATNTTLSVSESGEYYFQAQSTTYPSCSAVTSSTANLKVVTTPVVQFNIPTESCTNTIVLFSNQSVVDTQTAATYNWSFGDTQTSTDASPSHSYSAAQTYNVKLALSYGGNCLTELTKTIKIISAPTVTIIAPSNQFKFCPDTELKLNVNGTFASYLWSTGETTSSIVVKQKGSYSVSVTNTVGCTANATAVSVDLFPAPNVTAEATPNQISAGETVQLKANGLATYDWDPGKLLSDSTVATPTTTPSETTLFKVIGKDANGCIGQATIEVNVKGESTTKKLKPSNFFSPNGDATNNTWSVEGIISTPQCAVAIYDDKGIKLYESKPYENNWDGSFQGKPLPNGVYFYIIRCDGEESTPKTGSITLIR